MRKTFRKNHNKEYWQKRWSAIQIDEAQEDETSYPLKYALKAVHSSKEAILEAGCGNGRILRYFSEKGYNIEGFDFIGEAINNLKKCDPKLRVEVGDIKDLKYDSCSFDCILAFGLYHNLEENDLIIAIKETARIMKNNGRLCASFRADNFQNRINDFMADRKCESNKDKGKSFHKLNLKPSELSSFFQSGGFNIDKIIPVENMPLFYKFKFFRSKTHKIFNESLGRKEGYKLNSIGKILQGLLIKIFPHQFCNIYVLFAHKPKN